jgi:hypothetical protein
MVKSLYKNKKLKKTAKNNEQIKEQMEEETFTNISFFEMHNNKYYKSLLTSFFYLYNLLKISVGIVGIYFIWIVLHYIASHLYVRFCVPNTFYGFLISPFMIATPYCIGLRWLVYTGANTVNNMWILFGSWATNYISTFSSHR